MDDKVNDIESPEYEGNAIRGLVFALPISLGMWAVILLGIPALVNWYIGLLQ